MLAYIKSPIRELVASVLSKELKYKMYLLYALNDCKGQLCFNVNSEMAVTLNPYYCIFISGKLLSSEVQRKLFLLPILVPYIM